MFDCYEPEDITCPRCGSLIESWQGKCGPCQLVTWRQGIGNPVDQMRAPEFRIPNEQLQDWRLPASFRIYASCPNCDLWCPARGACTDGIWTQTRLLQTLDEQLILDVLRKFDPEAIRELGCAATDYVPVAHNLSYRLDEETSRENIAEAVRGSLSAHFSFTLFSEIPSRKGRVRETEPALSRAAVVDAIAQELFALLKGK
jgi:hypothetical protein